MGMVDQKHQEGHQFLFGSRISEIYYDHGIDAVVKAIKEDSHDWEVYDWDGLPTALLDAADGWGGYVQLDLDEYLTLEKLQK